MKKKILALLLVLIMAFSTSIVILASGGNHTDDIYTIVYIDFYDLGIVDVFDEHTGLNMELLENPELLAQFLYDREIMRQQVYALEAYNLLMDEFMSRNRSGEIEFNFWDNYAGAFIDENHNLIIQVTDMERSTVAQYQSLVSYSDVVSFKEVDFSLNELNEFGRIFVDALKESNLQITSYGLDIRNNSFGISLYYADEENVAFISSFNIISRTLPIPVSISLGTHLELDVLEGGGDIGTFVRPNSFSIGATGVGSSGNVLVTTGHFSGITTGMAVFRNGVSIGTVLAFRNGPNSGGNPVTNDGDWAIIRLNSHGEGMMTNRLRTGERLSPNWQDFRLRPTGTIVTGTGSRTISWSGTVEHTLQNFSNASGITLVIPRFNSSSQGGDSGGTIVVAGTAGFLQFDGVHAGRRSNADGSVRYLAYSPAIWFEDFFVFIPPLN